MDLQKRKNHRLRDFDYGACGYYYVTICTQDRKNLLSVIHTQSDAPVALFCDVPSPTILPTPLGEKVVECINNIERLNDNVEIDKFVLMPNHVHAIIVIKNAEQIELKDKKYAFQIAEQKGRRSLQGVIRDFKSVTTRYYKKTYNTDCPLWQKSFYDEIIEREDHYYNVLQYIEDNPMNWVNDKYNMTDK